MPGGGGGAFASSSGALLAQPAITAASAAMPTKRVPRIIFLPAITAKAKIDSHP